ncbi:MAG: tyrosyl-tRNA synthetase [Parcubacteria group bacterium Athens0416_74]|nr:MAG: tyrosyl-tRNA synthetase [Parcubacteria group bacterium Athens0416_74]
MAKLSEILRERGYVHQHSSETLEEITDGQKRTVYLGIDPSADSLHVGNLVGLLALRHFIEDGHKVIILTGGGTGMIGDPGGKSEERNLLDEETVARNASAVAAQIRQVFGGKDFIEENNAKWLSTLNLLEFLRDVGKHFTVNAMIKKDIVRDRLEKESPISFTEFSYSLLQGFDYLHLNSEYGCDVQVGGSDQWSNILAGVEFVRRKEEKSVYALTWPLVVNKSTGKKFGKSEEGAIWLDAKKTSPFRMYQFFLNVDDEAVGELLLKLTLLPKATVDDVVMDHAKNPGARFAQRKLAQEVTRIVHGDDALAAALTETDLRFKKDLTRADKDQIRTDIEVGMTIADVLVAQGYAESKSAARRLVEGKAVKINGTLVDDVDRVLGKDDVDSDGMIVLTAGKSQPASVLALK